MPNIAGTALNEKVTIKYTRPSRNNKFQRSDRVPPYENRYSATLVNTKMVKSKAIAMTEGQDKNIPYARESTYWRRTWSAKI